jgi:hypothetical protein
MPEPSGEDYPPATTRRSVEVAMARMEAKLDVAIAQHQARLDEHSRRIHDLTVEQNQHGQRLGEVEQKQAAADARDATRPATQPWTTYVSLGVALLLAIYTVLNNYGPGVP